MTLRPERLRGTELAEIRQASRILVGSQVRLAEQGGLARELLLKQDPQVVLDYWRWNRVLLLSVHRARGVGAETDAWAEAEAELRPVAIQMATEQELTTLKVTRILARDGIKSVSLKGPLMARRLYGDVALRDPSSDVDILVAASNLDRAGELLQRHGWQRGNDPLTQGALPEHHASFTGPTGTPSIDLHWRIQWFDRREHTDRLLQRAEATGGVPQLAADDLRQALLLFWSRDGFHKLRLGADISASRELAPRLPATAPARLLTPVLTAEHVADEVLGGRGAGSSRHRRRRTAMAASLAATDRRSAPRQIHSRKAVVDLLSADSRSVRRVLSSTWFRHSAVLAVRHPALARGPQVHALRVVSMLRTAADTVHLVLRGS